MVTLEIDGQVVTAPCGTSILQAAAAVGINIPKLCATDKLKPFGSCRLCLVEIEGRKGTPSSCTTPVEEGLKVHTQSPRLARLRRGVMELYISDHPLDCLTCAANGDCELQDMAGVVGLREVRYGYNGANHIQAAKDESNPYFTFDPSKCIVCSRCVRACEEIQGTFALTISGRGFASAVSAGGKSFLDSECVSCGACVQACPTATLIEKTVIEKGQAEHSVVTTCAYCGVGCSFEAEMQGNEVVRMTPRIQWTWAVFFALITTAVFATAVALAVQSWAQQHTTPTRTALIFSMEPVFAWVTSYLLSGEVLSMRATLGAFAVLAGILVVELRGGGAPKEA